MMSHPDPDDDEIQNPRAPWMIIACLLVLAAMSFGFAVYFLP